MYIKCRVHVDFEDHQGVPANKKIGVIANRITQSFMELCPEELSSLISAPRSRSWMPGIMAKSGGSYDWSDQQIFVVELDKSVPFSQVLDRLHLFGLDCTIAYNTYSAGKGVEKYRLVFYLDKRIDSLVDFEEVKLSFSYLFPEMDKKKLTPITTYHGGGEVFYFKPDYIMSTQLLLIASDVNYISSADSERTLRNRAQKVAEKRTSNNIIIDMRKTAEIEVERNFDFMLACRKSKILMDFYQKKQLPFSQLFGLATNLRYVEGGLGWFEERMKTCGSYPAKHFSVIPYVRRMNFRPQGLKSFSPYQEDFRYEDILTAGKLQDGEVIIHKTHTTICLDIMEKELQTTMQKILQSEDRDIHVVIVPTGVGKTESILNCRQVIIGCDTHKQKNELLQRFKVPAVTTPEIPLFSDKALNHRIKELYKCGASHIVMNFLVSIAFKSHLHNDITSEDVAAAKDFLDNLEAVRNTKDTIITTHHRSINNLQHDTIIFDEDPLTTIFLPIEKISRWDLLELKMKISDPTDRNNLQMIIDQVENAGRNVFNILPTFAFNEPELIEQLLLTEMNISSPILNFFDSEAFVLDEKDQNVIYFIKKMPELPDKKIIILSATANEWIYKKLFGARVKFYNLGNVELKGKLIQDTSCSYSRSRLKDENTLNYAIEQTKDMLVLTFAGYTQKFKTSLKDIYFGNCRGTDTLNGQRLAIVGTPHVQVGTYLLLAYQLGLQINSFDYKMSKQRVEHKGLEFNFYTFANPMLRNIQFFFIESELKQAIGRARLSRRPDAYVLLLSNFPLPEVKQFRRAAIKKRSQ